MPRPPPEFSKGKNGVWNAPMPIMTMSTNGDRTVVLVAGGGGAGSVKEVPNMLYALSYNPLTHDLTTLASLNTGKGVVVYLSFSSTAGLYLASVQAGCKIVSYDEATHKLSEVCEWTSEEEGKEPEQNFARFSADAAMIVTGGSDGVLKLWNVGKEASAKPALRANCGQKGKEILDGDFSPDSKHVVACDAGGSCRLWKVEDAESDGTALTFPKPNVNVKGGVMVKLVRFCSRQDGSMALVMAANGPRGPALVSICDLDGMALAQLEVDKTCPLKSMLIDEARKQIVIGLTSGAKGLWSFPEFKCLKKTKPLHELPVMEALVLEDGTFVSGSGDRSLHFLPGRRAGTSGSMLRGLMCFAILIVVLLMLLNIGFKAAILQQGAKLPEQDL